MRSLIVVGLVVVSAAVIMAKPASEVTAVSEKDSLALKAVSESSGLFAGNFFKTVAKKNENKNLITSPLSASIVLAMTQYGARQNTQKEMKSVLHLPEDEQVSRTGYKNLINILNNTPNVTLNVANKVFVHKDLELQPEFKALTSENFRSEAQSVDFSKAAEAVSVVNSWADAQTNHKIKEILKTDDVNGDTALVLCNALYFKGDWAEKFDAKNTKDRDFHLDSKTVKQVPTMYKKSKFFYGELPELKAKFVELPYKNKDLSMIIVLPDAVDGLSAVVDGLANVKISDLREKGYSRDVELYLPKFKIESSLPLNEPLQELGMSEMFSDLANFSGLAQYKGKTEGPKLKVGKVIQKAFIEVNEEGSEAAAVTAIGIVPLSMPPPPKQFSANRPFMYGIYSKNTNMNLFTGQVLDPLDK